MNKVTLTQILEDSDFLTRIMVHARANGSLPDAITLNPNGMNYSCSTENESAKEDGETKLLLISYKAPDGAGVPSIEDILGLHGIYRQDFQDTGRLHLPFNVSPIAVTVKYNPSQNSYSLFMFQDKGEKRPEAEDIRFTLLNALNQKTKNDRKNLDDYLYMDLHHLVPSVIKEVLIETGLYNVVEGEIRVVEDSEPKVFIPSSSAQALEAMSSNLIVEVDPIYGY